MLGQGEWRFVHYNRALLAATELTGESLRLALALGEFLLGWGKVEDSISNRQLREAASLHGRSLERARQALVKGGIVSYTPGQRGRGHGGHYRILEEKTAEARSMPTLKKTAPARSDGGASGQPVKDRTNPPKKTAPRRPSLKTVNTTDRKQQENAFRRAVFDAYQAVGGNLEKDGWRDILGRHAKTLFKEGVDLRVVVAAARELGLKRGFPGDLMGEARKLAAAGGPCKWKGRSLERLTQPQLGECDCPRCLKELVWRREESNRKEKVA